MHNNGHPTAKTPLPTLLRARARNERGVNPLQAVVERVVSGVTLGSASIWNNTGRVSMASQKLSKPVNREHVLPDICVNSGLESGTGGAKDLIQFRIDTGSSKIGSAQRLCAVKRLVGPHPRAEGQGVCTRNADAFASFSVVWPHKCSGASILPTEQCQTRNPRRTVRIAAVQAFNHAKVAVRPVHSADSVNAGVGSDGPIVLGLFDAGEGTQGVPDTQEKR